jgi:hypothetical protein
MPPSALTPAARRTRKHTKTKIQALARSIAEHGMLIPLRINADAMVLGGHALLEAALSLKMTEVPVVRIEHLTPEQERLYAIAENKLAEGSSWDMDALRVEFQEIAIAEPTIDLGRSAFVIAERDIIIGRHRVDELTDLNDDQPPEPEATVVSRMGDLFRLGRHTLLCGDSLDPASIAAVCDGRSVRSVVSDLPYNVPIAGHVCGLGSKTHRGRCQSNVACRDNLR